MDSNLEFDCMKQMQEQKVTIILSCSILFFLTMVLLGFMGYFTVKIHKMIWNKDKIFPLMLIMLCFSLLGVGIFWMFTIVQVMIPNWACGHSRSLQCSGSIVSILPSFFLGTGVILNLNKWIYFALRIDTFIKVGCGVCEKKKANETMSEVRQAEMESLVESESFGNDEGQ